MSIGLVEQTTTSDVSSTAMENSIIDAGFWYSTEPYQYCTVCTVPAVCLRAAAAASVCQLAELLCTEHSTVKVMSHATVKKSA